MDSLTRPVTPNYTLAIAVRSSKSGLWRSLTGLAYLPTMNLLQARNSNSVSNRFRFVSIVVAVAPQFFILLTIIAGTFIAGNLLCGLETVASAQDSVVRVGGIGESGISVPVARNVPMLPARELAEGVLTVIPPSQNANDTAIGPLSLDYVAKHPELEWSGPGFPKSEPNFASRSETLLEMGRDVTLRHPIWGLEFAFKPLRTIEADVPMASGKMQRKLVWYLVYRVRYIGGDLLPSLTVSEDGESVPEPPKPVIFNSVRFLPRFTLTDTQANVVRDSQILSTVIPQIAAKERIGKPVLDTFQISRTEILPSNGDKDNPVWGIATWTDVDGRADFLTVQVKGLTNAYQVKVDSAGNNVYKRKTLELHFWRPGDSLSQTQDRVRLGVPAFLDSSEQQYVLKQFGLEKRLDYQWVYR